MGRRKHASKKSSALFKKMEHFPRDLMKSVKGLCTPAQVYLGLSMISVLMNVCAIVLYEPDPHKETEETLFTHSWTSLMGHVLIIAVWTYLLNYICRKVSTTVSWILVALPFILSIFIFLFMTFIMSKAVIDVSATGDETAPPKPQMASSMAPSKPQTASSMASPKPQMASHMDSPYMSYGSVE